MRSVRRPRRLTNQSVAALFSRAINRASIELLENRQLLSAVVVNTAVDQTDTGGSATISLRDALAIASTASAPTNITFDPTVFATAQTITLQGGSYLSLSSSQDVTITAPAVGVTVDANGGSNGLVDSATAGSVSISNMTFTNGKANYGGAIEHNGSDTLTLTNVTVTGNHAYYDGGGIYNTGALVIDGSTISNNVTDNLNGTGGAGGGIDNSGGTLTLNDSTLSGNTAQAIGAIGGGGIHNSGSAVISDSTISENSTYANQPGGTLVDAPGGGVLSSGPMTITNSTIAGNTGSLGGGMDITLGATISDSTISGNTASTGGGLYLTTNDTIQNSVISGNTNLPSGSSPDVANAPGDSVASNGHNLVGESDGSSGWIASDTLGSVASPVNADLGPLADNGGPTQTMLPLPGSPLIGAGSTSLIPAGVTTDQRGLPRILNGAVDIGAVEEQPSITVTAPPNQSAVVGQSKSFALGSFIQTGTTGPYSISVNWGDGSPATTFSMGAAGTITPQVHTYAASGSDTVTVSVTDSSGTVTGSASFTVNVGVGAIVVIPPSNQTAFVGVSQSIALGSFTQTNTAGPYSVTVAWGMGSTNTTFSVTSAGTIPSHAHTFTATGSDTVTVTVTDSSGLVTNSATFGVTVTPGSITVTAPGSQTSAAGQNKAFNVGSFSAANTTGPYTVTVNWGDGGAVTTFSANAPGALDSQSHTYTSVGSQTVRVTVADSSGFVTGSTTFTVNVIAASITVTPPADQLASIGNAGSFQMGSFSAMSATAPFTVDISWGDSSSDTTFNQNSPGSIAAQTHTFAADGVDTVTIVVTDATGLTGMATFSVTVSSGTTPSSTSLEISSTSFGFGQSQTLTATVLPPGATGTVTFADNGQVLGAAPVGAGGVATLMTSLFSIGTSTVTATYGGDGTYVASVSPGVQITVAPPANTTALTLGVSSTTITTSQSVTLTATVTPADSGGVIATGTVTFYEGGTLVGAAEVHPAETGVLSEGQPALGTAPLQPDGVATFTTTTGLPPGINPLTARYSGDVNFAPSTSAAVNVDVLASRSATTLSLSNHSKTFSQAIVLSATITAGASTPTTLATVYPTGTVTFSEDGSVLGTVAVGAAGVATFTTSTPFSEGIDFITAAYNGSASFAASTSMAQDLYVTPHALVPVVNRVVVPAAAIGGVRVRGLVLATLTNDLSDIEAGPEKGIFAVRIYASLNTTFDMSTDTVVSSIQHNAKIAQGKSIRVSVPITSMPATLKTGTYHLLLVTFDAAGNQEWVDTGGIVNVTAPVISLSAGFVSVPVNVLKKGAILSIVNRGNVLDLSTFTAVVGLSTDAAGQKIVATGVGRLQPGKLLLRPGKASKLRISGWQLLSANLPAGSYYLTVNLTDAAGNSAPAVSPETISI